MGESRGRCDLRKNDVKRAVSNMWKVFLKHAASVHGHGRVAADERNGAEHAAIRARHDQDQQQKSEREGHRTLYMGGRETKPEEKERRAVEGLHGGTSDGEKEREEKQRRRTGLETTDEKREQLETVTVESSERRVNLWERMQTVSGGPHTMSNEVLPEGRPDKDVWWNPKIERSDAGKSIWKGELCEEAEAEAMADPLLCVLSRVTAFESAKETRVRVDGRVVNVW